jgi:hypothetical protein
MLGLGHKKVANVEPFERAIVDEELGGALQEVRPSEIVDPHARYTSPLPAVLKKMPRGLILWGEGIGP